MDRVPGAVEDGAGLLGGLRAQAQRAVRLPAALRAVPASGCSTGDGPGGWRRSICWCCSGSASRTTSSTGRRSACRCRCSTRCCSTCSGRALWIGLRGRGEGIRPVWPAAWLLIAALFLIGFRVGPQHRRLGRDRRRLRGSGRRRPDRPRRTALRQLPRRRLPGRHLRPGQLPRLRPLRGDLALARQLGRPARRPRRRGRLRPRHLRPADLARPPHPPRAGRPQARRDPRLRLGRLPLHRLRPRVELQRHARRRAAGRRSCSPSPAPPPEASSRPWRP